MTAADPSLLNGLVVLDLSRIIAGPLATQTLADFGAQVIKVENPDGGDPSRGYVATDDPERVSPLFENLNRNKQSIAIDLQKPRGITLLLDMARRADVLVHNYRSGVAERLGFGYEAVSAINPRLVYCGISGFGDTGPLRTNAANDVIVQAFSGVMSMTGEVGGNPVRCGPSVADATAGLYAAIGVLIGLVGRATTGRGCDVRTSLLEGQLSLVAHSLTEYFRTGFVAKPMGSGTRTGKPNEAFPTRDGEVLIAAVDEGVWVRLCEALKIPQIATDPRFAGLSARRDNHVELFEVISQQTRKMTRDECLAQVSAAGVPCAPINSVAQVAAAPQVQALDIIDELRNHGGVNTHIVRSPLRVDGSRPPVVRSAPTLGRDTQGVLDWAGLSAGEQADLLAGHIVT